MEKSMGASPGSSAGDGSFPPALPPIGYERVAIENLDFPRDLFDDAPASPPAPLDPLLPVIAARRAGGGRMTIVDGCKRFVRLRESGAHTCMCGVFDGFLDEKRIGLVRIFLNQKRQTGIRESVSFFRWLARNFQGGDLDATLDAAGFLPALRSEIEPLAACSEDILRAIDEGRLNARCAAELCQWEAKDQSAFLERFRGLVLSSQTQREFIEWLPEIGFERKESVAALLQSEKIREITGDGVINNPQKIEAIRTLLFSWKFPLFEGAMEKWKKTAAATSRSATENAPSSKVVFMPNPAFEMNKLEIRITINHAPVAGEIFRKLAEVPQSTWSHLIYPL
jgi:hypothetical protein